MIGFFSSDKPKFEDALPETNNLRLVGAFAAKEEAIDYAREYLDRAVGRD